MQEEVWRPVPGYEDWYEVSNMGRVKQLERDIPIKAYSKRLKHIEEKIFEINESSRPVAPKTYYGITLINKWGKHVGFQLHRLVCMTFHDNPDNKPCVDHINGNRHDNRAENLRWATYSENFRNHYPYNIPLE